MTNIKTYKIDILPRLIYFASFLFLLFTILANHFKFNADNWILLTGIIGIVGVLPQLCLAGTRLILYDSIVEQVNCFFYRKKIDLARITAVKYVVGYAWYKQNKKISLYDNDKYQRKPLSINLKPWTRLAVKEISRRIIESARYAVIDEQIRQFANNKF